MLSLEGVLDALPLFDTEETSLKYSKEARRKGAGCRYEELVIALVYLRCLRKQLTDFQLTADNRSYAGMFDDVVVTWSANRDKYSLLVQLKHKTSQEFDEIRKGSLFSSSDNNRSGFNISKYLQSFRTVKQNLSGVQYALVISTNIPLHENALEYFRERRTNSVLGAELIEAGGRVYELDPKAVTCEPDFIKHFFVFCTQKGVNEIMDDICVELERLLGPSDSYDRLCEELCRCVMEWKDTPEANRDVLDGSWTKWEDIVLQHKVSTVTDCNGLTTRLKFRDVGIVREHVERSNPAYVRPLSADTMALSVTKVHQAIYPETHILVNVRRFAELQHSVLRLWGPFCRWLVLIDDDTEEQRQYAVLLNKVRQQIEIGRRLVVVSLRNAASFQDSFCFTEVSDESWDDLLLTKIRLNGDKHDCQLCDLVSSGAELQTMLKHRIPCLIALARNSDYVKLGQSLDPLPANYVPRHLVTRRYVKDEFFSSLSVRDVCIIDNSNCQIFLDKLSSLMKNYKVCSFDDLEGYLALHASVPILAKAERIDIIALERICKKFKGLHVYIVKHTEYGWVVQRFNAGNGRIQRYVREQEIKLLEALDVSNRVIVEGRPGIGKSTVLLEVAREMKQNNPSCWVVRINLRECYERFEKHMSGKKISEFILWSVVSNEGELAGLEFMLLKHCLQKHKHILCLVDSFDELYPSYTKEVLQALRLLSPRQGKLVVTTRPTAARLLEDHLGSLAHLLPAFSDDQLQKYFKGFRLRVSRMGIDTLTKQLEDLLRIPLFAEMYKDLMEVGAGSYDTLSLYETFFHYKFGKTYVEKFGDNLSDPGKIKEVKRLWQFHETKLKHLACIHLVQNEDLLQQHIRVSEDDNFMEARVVHQVSGKMPVFKHRTFGEYFLAKWCYFDAGQKDRATVYLNALKGRSLEFFLEVFDRMASRGHQLSSAVLDGGERKVRALLQAGVGLAERDIWGRSALHLAAAGGVGASLVRLLCQHMEGALAEEDGLLHWTPLRYAANGSHWGTVEALLQAGANLIQLGNIQDAVSLLLLKNSLRVNPLVQNLLVRIAEECGYSKVLNMLWKIYGNAERRHMNVDSEISEDFKDYKNNYRNRRTELHFAIQCGDEDKVRKLIMQGADLYAQDEDGIGTLHWAAHFNRVNCIELLIGAGLDFEVQDGNGQTALHCAVKAEATDVVNLLIEVGVYLEAWDKDGRTALHYAARLGNSKCARLLVSAGAEVDVRDNFGATPLHYAAEEDSGDIVRLFTDAGADVEARDDNGMSALHYAALQGSVNCARLLLFASASVHTWDNIGATPLHYAVEANAADIVSILTEAGARVHQCDEDGMTALHYAADHGSAICARLLVNTGAEVNAQDNFGATPLHYAVKANDPCIAKLLIDAGANLQVSDMLGKTPLHYAAHQGNVECASLLIGAGADVNVGDKVGATPLHYAAEENAVTVTELLIESRPRPYSRNEHAITALHNAASWRSVKGARLLISDVISVNVPDKDGATPLHYAARAPNVDCASLLVHAGADICVQDKGGLTALHYAACARNPECITFLIGAGSGVNVRDKKGATALHYAAMSDYMTPCRMDRPDEGAAECIRRLLALGAHPGTREEQGKTALHYAVSAVNVACVGVLLDAGFDVLDTDKNGETALHCAVKAGSSMCFTLLLHSVVNNSTS